MPVSLSQGQIRIPEFTTNLKAQYIIEIEVQKKIPFDTLNCLLGVEPDHSHPEKCTNTPSVVNASWVLSSRGDAMARGSTAKDKLGSWGNDVISRQIGGFESERGRHYTLDVTFLGDGSPLAAGNPRLKVGAHPMYYESDAFADILFLVMTTILVLAGAIMLVVSTLRARHIGRELH